MISPLNTPGNKKKQRAEGSPLLLLAACSHLDAPEPAFVAIPPWVGAVGARRGPWARPRPEPGSGVGAGSAATPGPAAPSGPPRGAERRHHLAETPGGTGPGSCPLPPCSPPKRGHGREGREGARSGVGSGRPRPAPSGVRSRELPDSSWEGLGKGLGGALQGGGPGFPLPSPAAVNNGNKPRGCPFLFPTLPLKWGRSKQCLQPAASFAAR